MSFGRVEAALLAWPVVVVALFRVVGPRRAALLGVLGGFLALPSATPRLDVAGFGLAVDRYNVTGLALIAGVLIFDRAALRAARPSRLDLAMVAYGLAPLVGLATGVPGAWSDVLDATIGRGLGWVVPYAMGRLYFSRPEGPAEVAEGLILSGLCCIPICLYEEVAGPSRYLAGLVYGLPYNEGMVDRLGGYRPEGFVGDGLTLAAWMALTASTATWLGLGGRRIGRLPAWAPATALVLACLSCRGVYGYILLATGVGASLATRLLRTRVVLAGLLALPVLYMALRASGAWDGSALVRGAALLGRPGTVDWRLRAEDGVISRVLARGPAFGFGNYIWHGEGFLWPDGAWLHALWMGGLVGLTLRLAALYVVPAAVALARPPGRPEGWQAASPSWALACWCILQMGDGMHNTSYLTPTALVAGTLVGLAGRRGRSDPPPGPTLGAAKAARAPSSPPRGRSSPPRGRSLVPLIVTVAALIAVEVLGRWAAGDPLGAPNRPTGPRPIEARP